MSAESTEYYDSYSTTGIKSIVHKLRSACRVFRSKEENNVLKRFRRLKRMADINLREEVHTCHGSEYEGKGTQEVFTAGLGCSFSSFRSSMLAYGEPGREALMGKPKRVIRVARLKVTVL